MIVCGVPAARWLRRQRRQPWACARHGAHKALAALITVMMQSGIASSTFNVGGGVFLPKGADDGGHLPSAAVRPAGETRPLSVKNAASVLAHETRSRKLMVLQCSARLRARAQRRTLSMWM